MDSHADTVVLGKNCVILAYTGRECDVSPYTDYYDAIKGVPIVTGATAWTCQADGETYILVFNEALWMGETMDHSLINPNQLRHFGIYVQDNPYGRRSDAFVNRGY
jgi:PhoPQ-activated pathogenicity-related protein